MMSFFEKDTTFKSLKFSSDIRSM